MTYRYVIHLGETIKKIHYCLLGHSEDLVILITLMRRRAVDNL